MQFATCSLLALVVTMAIVSSASGFSFGTKRDTDIFLYRKKVYVSKKFLQVVSTLFSFPEGNVTPYERITYIKATDMEPSPGGQAILHRGGPDTKEVTIRFKSARGKPVNFLVEIWGVPANRKRIDAPMEVYDSASEHAFEAAVVGEEGDIMIEDAFEGLFDDAQDDAIEDDNDDDNEDDNEDDNDDDNEDDNDDDNEDGFEGEIEEEEEIIGEPIEGENEEEGVIFLDTVEGPFDDAQNNAN